MDLSPGAGKALALIGLVPVAYKTHELEGALPHLAQRAQELHVPTWLLISPVLFLLGINVWILRRIWERHQMLSLMFVMMAVKYYWQSVSNLELGLPPNESSPTLYAWVSVIMLALAVGLSYLEKRRGVRSDLRQEGDAPSLSQESAQLSAPQPSIEPAHVTMPK